MPTIGTVEQKIKRVEGFDAKFMQNGVDVKANKEGIPQYDYPYAARDNWTISEWKEKRFKQKYPGYDVKVLAKDGTIPSGQTTLGTIRGKK